jgi:hypothetical protein
MRILIALVSLALVWCVVGCGTAEVSDAQQQAKANAMKKWRADHGIAPHQARN